MVILFSFFLLLFSFLTAAAITALSAYRYSESCVEHKGIILSACLGLGPIIFALLLSAIMYVFPGQEGWFYVAAVSVIGVLALSFLWQSVGILSQAVQMMVAELTTVLIRPGLSLILIGVLAVGLAALLVSAAILPLVANDSLEYAQVSRQIYSAMDPSVYPVVDSINHNGFYGAWSHPNCYAILLVWGYIVQGSISSAGVIKLVAPYFTVCTVILILTWGGGLRRTSALIGAILLLFTPLYYSQSLDNSIDPLRIFSLVALLASYQVLQRDLGYKRDIVQGAILACCLYTHSVSVLAIPILVALYVYFDRRPIPVKLGAAVLCTVTALIIISPFYVRNFQLYGSLISDSPALWTLPELNYERNLREVRGLFTTRDRLISGLFKGFSKTETFGITYWLVGVAILFQFGIYRKRALDYISAAWSRVCSATTEVATANDIVLFILLLFHAMVVASLVIDIDLFIKNDRYALTIQPFIAIYAGKFFGDAYDRLAHQEATRS